MKDTEELLSSLDSILESESISDFDTLYQRLKLSVGQCFDLAKHFKNDKLKKACDKFRKDLDKAIEIEAKRARASL